MFGLDDMLAGGLSLAGGLINNMWGDKRQQEAQQFSAQEANANRQFQEQMSNTAYQRGMADMKAAGLNPILAYQKGPASSPTGAMASTSTGQPTMDMLTPAVSTAQQHMRLKAEVDNMHKTNENIQADTTKKDAEGVNAAAMYSQIKAQTAAIEQQRKNMQEQWESLKTAAQNAKNEREFHDSWIGRIMDIGGLGGRRASQVLSPVTDIIGGTKAVNSIFSERFRGYD